MELVERIQYIMKLNQLSASAFADEIGVQRSSVSHVISGRNKPSLEFIQKIIKRYPKVDSTWLIEGTTSGIAKEDVISNPKLESTQSSISYIQDENKSNLDKVVETSSTNKAKKISRILVFYDDNTFEEFNKGLL